MRIIEETCQHNNCGIFSYLSCVNCDYPTANLLLTCPSGTRCKAGKDILLTAVEASVGGWGGRRASTAIETLLPEVIGGGQWVSISKS